MEDCQLSFVFVCFPVIFRTVENQQAVAKKVMISVIKIKKKMLLLMMSLDDKSLCFCGTFITNIASKFLSQQEDCKS